MDTIWARRPAALFEHASRPGAKRLRAARPSSSSPRVECPFCAASVLWSLIAQHVAAAHPDDGGSRLSTAAPPSAPAPRAAAGLVLPRHAESGGAADAAPTPAPAPAPTTSSASAFSRMMAAAAKSPRKWAKSGTGRGRMLHRRPRGRGAKGRAFCLIRDTSTLRVLVVQQIGGKKQWMLPGGLIDSADGPADFLATASTGALRELGEESGLGKNGEVVNLSLVNRHKTKLRTFYPAHVKKPAYLFHSDFDFHALGHTARLKMFRRRQTGETRDYGFAALKKSGQVGQIEVQQYSGKPKRSNSSLLRPGTAGPIKRLFAGGFGV